MAQINLDIGSQTITLDTGAPGPKGDQGTSGSKGDPGADGADGADGISAGHLFAFSTTTSMADPGSGILRFNNATPASVTAIAIDDLDTNAADVSADIVSWGDSTATNKGTLIIREIGNPANFAVYTLTALTDNAGWTQLAVTYVTGAGTFGDADNLSVQFCRTGDDGADGADGAGTGDVEAALAFGTDNRVIRSDGTAKGVQASGITVDDSDNVTGLGTLNTLTLPASNFVGLTDTQTLTNKTLTSPTINTPALGADSVDAITEIASALKSGADGTLITGTAGTSGDLSVWNADGDLVDGPTPPSGTIVGTSDTQTLTNKTLDPTSNTVAGAKQTIYIPAGAMVASATSGAATGTVEASTNDQNYSVLDFDASADEYAHFQVAFPKGWNEGTVTFQAFWTTTATDTDGVAFGLQGVAVSDGDTIDASWGTAVVVTDDAQSAAGDVLVTAESSAVTIAGTPAEGDLCFFRVFRDVSDANDDMTEDARLIGIKLFYTASAINDD